MNPILEENTSPGSVKPKKATKQRRLSSRELMKEQGLHPEEGIEMTALTIGEDGAATQIEMQEKQDSPWSKLRQSVKKSNAFKADRKKRTKRLSSQVVKARRNSETSEHVHEIALPPFWEMAYDDAEESRPY